MILKQPFVVSTSGYNSPEVDWRQVNPMPAAVLCRASLGTPEWNGKSSVDQSFPRYWPQWKAMGMRRAAYHFAINDDTPFCTYSKQAKHFVKQVQLAGGWEPGDKIALDVEQEHNLSAHAIVDWFYTVLTLLPGLTLADCLLYSRRNILGRINWRQVSTSDQDYLRQIPQWPAGYPDDPDARSFEQLVEAYQFDHSHFGPCVLVQYAAAAVVEGISKPGYLSVECNAIAPDYLAAWKAPSAPAPPPPTGGSMYEITPVAGKAYINLRETDNVASADIGNLNAGQHGHGATLSGDGVQELWLHVTDIDGAPVNGWVAVVHVGQKLCDIKDLSGVPPAGVVIGNFNLTMPDGAVYEARDVQLTPRA